MTAIPRDRLVSTLVVLGLTAGCSVPTEDPAGPGLQAARAAAGITVDATTPSWGNRGEAAKSVTITGSGFAPGDQASWQRGGIADPKVQVLSTVFVSSTQLVATISIAPDASLDFYDIAVAGPGRKGGIGTERFEVTTAVALSGTTRALGVNSAGSITGGTGAGAFVWTPLGGLEMISGGEFSGRGISEDGRTVAGSIDKSPTEDIAAVWTHDGANWVESILPRDPAALGSGVRALRSDPGTGAATTIAGFESVVLSRKGKSVTAERRARLWTFAAGTWTRVVLPTVAAIGTAGQAWGVADDGTVVGGLGGFAAVWRPDGSGGWTTQSVGPSGSYLTAINPAGTIAVGVAGEAAWWQRTGAGWSGPFVISGCGRPRAVDDAGRIFAVCSRSTSVSTTTVIAPPYGSADRIYLGGLGDRTGGAPEGISRTGGWLVGSSNYSNGSGSIGVYWQIP
ncbi:MAG: hypothetical protein SFV24_02950 [Gemmatimonadales bacterium]|nr:hypothetical protein [Gemmatimonadales bacterium]